MIKYTKSVQFLALAAGTFLTLSILTPDSSASVPGVQDMRGVWYGFIQRASEPPDPGRMEITAQENRRFTGFQDPPEPGHTLSIEGTVSESGKVNYQGQSAESRVVGKMDLLDFGGGAAILNGSQTQILNDGALGDPCALVMRAFDEPAGTVLPNTEGRYTGTLSGDDGITGQINMLLAEPPDPGRPTSFPGTIEITIGGPGNGEIGGPGNFQLLGTINSGGRIIAIAHDREIGGPGNGEIGGPGNRMLILDLVLVTTPGLPATINGTFTLELHDGSVFDGAFQTQVSSDPRTDN